MKKAFLLTCSFIVILVTGCGRPSSEVLAITMVAETDVAATQTRVAMSTSTPTKTNTPTPTETPKPTWTPLPTITQNLAATQVYEDFFSEVQSYYDDGYLPFLNGEYVEMAPFEEEWAQMDWYRWWWFDEKLVADTFVMSGHFAWESASSTPNISGCGFVFDVDTEGGSAYAVVLDQSMVLVLDHYGYKVNTTRGTGKVKFTLPAEADFTLIVNNETKRIYIFVDEKFVGEYSIPLSEAIDGTIGFTVLSGTNKDYGTRCSITDIQLWLSDLSAEVNHSEPSQVAGCTDAIGCVSIAPGEPVHIAYMLTTSGATSFLGKDSKGAVEIAVDDRREVLGHEILLTGEDSGCNGEGGFIAAQEIIDDKSILGVIGTNCSSSATAAMDTISDAGLVMISPSNTAPALTLEGQTWKPGYYRTVHTDILQGMIAAEFAYNELGARKAATIHDGSPYSDQLQTVFANHFEDLGGTVNYQGMVYVGDTDMRSILTSVAAGNPDLLYFPVFEPEGDYIVAQTTEIAGLENASLMSADGLLADSFPENAGPNVVGMYLSGPYVDGSEYDAFLGKWSNKFGGVPPSGFHAFAYDATNILLDAIEAVAIVSDDGTLTIGRQAIRDYITNLSGYSGVTGSLDCTDKNSIDFQTSHGDCATGESIGIFQITGTELSGGWPPGIVYPP